MHRALHRSPAPYAKQFSLLLGVVLLLMMIVPPTPAEAQQRVLPRDAPSAAVSHDVFDSGASNISGASVGELSQQVSEYRNRKLGALYGLGIGAALGGAGFAGVNYAFTTSSPRGEYTLLSFLFGAVGGGAAGAVLGAIIGVPEREAPEQKQAELHIFPHIGQNQGLGIAVSLRANVDGRWFRRVGGGPTRCSAWFTPLNAANRTHRAVARSR